jgi:hypothetical protein
MNLIHLNQRYNVRPSVEDGYILMPFTPNMAASLCNDFQMTVGRLAPRRLLKIRWIETNWQQILVSRRASYINGMLIYTRGSISPSPCTKCRRIIRQSLDGKPKPFPHCVVMYDGPWANQCCNCKYQDKGASCRFDFDEAAEDRMDRDAEDVRQAPRRAAQQNMADRRGLPAPVIKEESSSDDGPKLPLTHREGPRPIWGEGSRSEPYQLGDSSSDNA